MNLQRGFLRVFVILWVLYAVSVVLYPFYEDEKNMAAAASLSVLAFNNCLNDERNKGAAYGDQLKVCNAADDPTKAIERVGLGTNWKQTWAEFGWHLLWAVPAVLLIPPLMVYGGILLLVKLGRWIVVGFRESPR